MRLVLVGACAIACGGVALWLLRSEDAPRSSTSPALGSSESDGSESPRPRTALTIEEVVPPAARASVSNDLHCIVRWPDGRAAIGASVHLFRVTGDQLTEVSHVSTTDRGDFRFERRDPGEYLVIARSRPKPNPEQPSTLGPWRARAECVVPTSQPVELVLSPMESLRGRVVGRDGVGLTRFELDATPVSLSLAGGDVGPFTCDFESRIGEFELVGLSSGTWDVYVAAAGHADRLPVRITIPRKEPLELELLRTVELRGNVYDASGHPLGCEVHARWPSVGDMIIASRASATSWGDGYFHIARIAPAVVEVFARHEGVDSEVVTLDLTRGESREGIAVRFARR